MPRFAIAKFVSRPQNVWYINGKDRSEFDTGFLGPLAIMPNPTMIIRLIR